MDHRAGFVLKVNVARIAWSHIRAVERWKGVAEKVVRQPIGFFIHPSRAMSGLAPALYVKRPLAFWGRHVACVFNRYRWIFAIRGNCQAGSSQNRAGALTPANTTQVAELQRLPSIARTGIVGISVCEWAIRNFVAAGHGLISCNRIPGKNFRRAERHQFAELSQSLDPQ